MMKRVMLGLAGAAAVFVAGCDMVGELVGDMRGQTDTVATPVASPQAGAVPAGTPVTLSTTTADAVIYYTVDGADPASSGTPFTAAITVSTNTIIRAVAKKSGMADSAILTAAYTIDDTMAAAPVASVDTGTYDTALSVTLSTATAGGSIYYTVDGSVPSATNGMPYAVPVAIKVTATLKAVTVKEDLKDSPVMVRVYTIAPAEPEPPAELDPAAAAQLADELNAIKAGIATVDDARVTLTGGFTPAVDLTVPKGVTLDLTAHGAGILLRDTVLTVNGTVNTTFDYGTNSSGGTWNAPSIRLEDRATWTTIDGSGTIFLKGKGRLLEVSGNHNVADRKLTLDGVTLVGVADNDQPLVEVRSGGDERSGHFIMKSGKITGNTCTRNGIGDGNDWVDGSGVRVHEGGTFTMKGGEISGNHAVGSRGSGGGGVAASENGIFIMEGGTISGNSATSEKYSGGGGVNVVGDGALFTLKGGTISGNSATSEEWSGGAGVRVDTGALFTLEGGTVYGKTGKLPEGADTSLANSSAQGGASLSSYKGTAKWGTGGTYTIGNASGTGGSAIVTSGGDSAGTDETLIAVPGK